MRKAVLAGLVGFGLLAGCVGPKDEYQYSDNKGKQCFKKGLTFGTPEFDQCVGASVNYDTETSLKRANKISSYVGKCVIDYGYLNGTPELSKCVQSLDEAAIKKKQDDMKALSDAFSSAIGAMNPTTCNTSGFGSGGVYNSTTTCR